MASTIGSDFYITAIGSKENWVDESRITDFLNEQKGIDNAVLSYSYVSP